MEHDKTALIGETKKIMEYTEERRTCEFCKHCGNGYDNMGEPWTIQCNFSNIAPFQVKHHGSCKYFQSKA